VARFDSEAGTVITFAALQDLQILIPDWADDALCIGNWKDFDATYEGSGRPTNEFRARIAKALATCQECPVRQNCLDDALRDEMDEGEEVWSLGIHTIRGGLLPEQRLELLKSIRQS
jgi:hypothetical protein